MINNFRKVRARDSRKKLKRTRMPGGERITENLRNNILCKYITVQRQAVACKVYYFKAIVQIS